MLAEEEEEKEKERREMERRNQGDLVLAFCTSRSRPKG